MLRKNLPPADLLQLQFLNAKPFKHLCIDNFLEQGLATGLLEQFPKFDPEKAKNEHGKQGGKATHENVLALGPAYQQFDQFVSSPSFLKYLSQITGIPDLLYDPEYFGGGTHDNQHGQELDVHVDFNYHRSTKLHRRLNLIIYLNHEWELDWGGNIELHSDPRNPENNSVIQFAPLFNRCVIFETNEISWHGFSQIVLPKEKRSLSRKSMTVYFYTRERPAEEIVPPHNTFYIQRPLPPSIQAGEVLSDESLKKIVSLLRKRDTWIEFYQKLELSLNRDIQHLQHLINEYLPYIGPQLQGYMTPARPASGYHPDHWIGDVFQGAYQTSKDIREIHLDLFLHDALPAEVTLRFNVNGSVTEASLPRGEKSCVILPCVIQQNQSFTLEIRSSHSFCPQELGMNNDPRRLVGLLEGITAIHS